MKVVFRVDSSARMGTGHIMRCLTLAESLCEHGVHVHFICRDHAGNILDLVKQNDRTVTVLSAPTIKETTLDENYARWLGVTQVEDAEQTIEALNGEAVDWLVVDHYGLDIEWEQCLRPYVNKLMVIDDLANRHHDCDVLLDQNYALVGESKYAGLIPDSCKLLLGPGYALLRREYTAYRKTLRTRDRQIKKILVFFGGSDPQNMTGMALEALSHPDHKNLEVVVVVGTNNPYRKAIEQQVLLRPLTTLHGVRPHLADLMAQADLAIGAGGATTWERMCLGLPTVTVSVAENQRPACEALAEAKLIYYAGHVSDIKAGHFTQLLRTLVLSTDKLTKLVIQNQLQVDGFGALRLVEVLCPSAAQQIRLRPACEEDVVFYYNWVNESEVRKNSVNTAPILWATHKAWFIDKLHDKKSRLFVLEAAGLPVGQIRFDKEGDEARIDYSLDSIVRGRGWGSRLVALGADLMQKIESVRLRAEVMAGNDASSAVFLRLGFTETSSPLTGGEFRIFYRNPVKSSKLDG